MLNSAVTDGIRGSLNGENTINASFETVTSATPPRQQPTVEIDDDSVHWTENLPRKALRPGSGAESRSTAAEPARSPFPYQQIHVTQRPESDASPWTFQMKALDGHHAQALAQITKHFVTTSMEKPSACGCGRLLITKAPEFPWGHGPQSWISARQKGLEHPCTRRERAFARKSALGNDGPR